MCMKMILRIWIIFLVPSISSLVIDENDFRFIPYEDLAVSSTKFSDTGVTSFSQLLFDVSRSQLIVGSRDYLYRLTLHDFIIKEKELWMPSENNVTLCLNKGQSEKDCHNYIKVLLTDGTKIFTCGTNAFSPTCSWRNFENLSEVSFIEGTAKCPYNPRANITALLTENNEYFVGTPTDFSGSDPAIYRSLGSDPPLRTNQYNSKWLNDPQFVGSFETDLFVYFLFREPAVEYINCGKVIYSRVARVCKNDVGGQWMLKKNWTTFLKARLNCSIPGDYPFYFNEIQGMTYIESEGLIYATFTTPENSIKGSAICAFNVSSIEAAFNGVFKYQEHSNSAWEMHNTSYQKHFECHSTLASRSHILMDSSKYQLLNDAVQPITLFPLYKSELETFLQITVDVFSTHYHPKVHVLFLVTKDGYIKKISVLPEIQKACLVEIWKPLLNKNLVPVYTMQYLRATNSIYVGTEENILRIPVEHCNRHKTKESCLNSMDPYCGWNHNQDACTPSPSNDPRPHYWEQNVLTCPIQNAVVEGGWSSWSDWQPCYQQSLVLSDPTSNDNCLCQTRKCNNPTPNNGGRFCKGASVRVTNCTVHGLWTHWSAWSSCSATCGIAVKTRRRSCSNPAPAHGGRVCVGQDHQEVYCTENPPCPSKTMPPIDGQWGSWGPWSRCSSTCGTGIRIRQRSCDSPMPRYGGRECTGCSKEYEECSELCFESKRVSQWTPWIRVHNASHTHGFYTERRLRFTCRSTDEMSKLKLSLTKQEEKKCFVDGRCEKTNEDGGVWGDWSEWSECSTDCGGGKQFRVRACEAGTCDGEARQSRTCNTHPCDCSTPCYGEWSSCSVSCGIGQRYRSKYCPGTFSEKGRCSITIEYEPCQADICNSINEWQSWTDWSPCDSNGEQKRTRKCDSSSCRGHNYETRLCKMDDPDNELVTIEAHTSVKCSGLITIEKFIGYCIVAFIVGNVFACLPIFLYLKFRRTKVIGSPHYITTSSQNTYVSVPLKEVSSNLRADRTLNNSKINCASPSKLYPKSMTEFDGNSFKRNSHSINNGSVAKDFDKFY